MIVSFFNAKDLNIDSLEKEIITYNREGKHKVSQKKLSEILLSGDLSEEEKGNVLFLLATTYRSVNDYLMCIDYLDKSNVIAQKLPKENPLRMKIDYEFAFVYFDNKDYEKSSKAMKRIAEQNYLNAYPEDMSYILMQEGYLFLQDNRYDEAEKKYNEAFEIMEKASHCNLPVVLGKMMELYSRKKDIKKVEDVYDQGKKISESCSILKYKVFLAAEMERIFKENDMFDKAYAIGLELDSLRKLEDQGNVISEMHIIDKEYLEKGQQKQEKIEFQEKIGAIIVALILLSFVAYIFLKSKKLKKEKLKMKEEIEQIKEDLNSYSQNSYIDENFVDSESSIINSEKLTDRQKDLLKLMTDGLSNKEIAEKLFITESTVKYHIKNIYSILELKDRKDLFKKISQK